MKEEPLCVYQTFLYVTRVFVALGCFKKRRNNYESYLDDRLIGELLNGQYQSKWKWQNMNAPERNRKLGKSKRLESKGISRTIYVHSSGAGEGHTPTAPCVWRVRFFFSNFFGGPVARHLLAQVLGKKSLSQKSRYILLIYIHCLIRNYIRT